MKLFRTQNEYDTTSFIAGETIAIGSLLKLASGKLALDNATPEYIALQAGVENDEILVHQIKKDEEYSAIQSADGSELTVGSVVTVTKAGEVTATTTNGIFKILEFQDGVKTKGGVVVGKFI